MTPTKHTALKAALTELSRGRVHIAREILTDAIDPDVDTPEQFVCALAANWIDLGQPLMASMVIADFISGRTAMKPTSVT